MWRALRPHRRGAGFGREGSHHCQQQHGYRWPRSGNPVGKQAGQQGDLVLCGGKQTFRGAVLGWGAGGGIHSPGNPGGTAARRWRRHPRVLHRHRCGNHDREGKPEAVFDGKRYIQERGIVADLGLVHAHTGDIDGNLVYRLTAQNFNPLCAASGKVTIAEVENLVGRGEIEPDRIQTPGVYVDHIIQAQPREKPIEKRTTR